jgi:hypothetical protein
LIILIILVEEYKLWSSSLCSFPQPFIPFSIEKRIFACWFIATSVPSDLLYSH